MPPEKLQVFKEYRNYINSMGNLMPMAFEKLSENLHSTDKYRYLLSILMATELIKVKLRALIILDDYISELRWYVEKNGEHSIRKMNQRSGRSFGQTLNDFDKVYNIKENNNELYVKLIELNKKRNTISHKAVLDYAGDIEKADQEIMPYILTQVLDGIQGELTKMINTRSKLLKTIQEELKDLNLF